jgi:biopolymer transport protein ExbD
MRKLKDTGPKEINLGSIITPMLDMAFQLLVFFIVTYHPSALEGHVDGNLLPPTKVATKGPKSVVLDELPIDSEPLLTDVLMVQIKAVHKGQTEVTQDQKEIRTEGQPSRLLIKKPEGIDFDQIAANEGPFKDGLKRLKVELEKFIKDTGAKANIKIEADGELMHQYTMEVFDLCKIVGFQNVSLVAPADIGQPK